VDEQTLRQLNEQLFEMTAALRDLSSGGLRIDDTRLLVALAKFAERTNTQSRGMDQFIREVDTATKELRDQTQAQVRAERSADDLAEAQSDAATATRKVSQTQQVYDALQQRSSQRWNALNERGERSALALWNSYGGGVSATGMLRESFEGLGGDSLAVTGMLKGMTAAADGATKALMQYGSALYQGQTGAVVGAKAVQTFSDTVTNAAMVFGGLLTLVSGPLGLAITGLAVAIKAITGLFVEATEISDRLFKAYQDLAKSGVSAGDGMQGLREDILALGMGLDQAGVDAFARLMQQASTDLAIFSGNVVSGRKAFVAFATGITRGPAGLELERLGFTVEEINEGLASYLGLQSRVGRAQQMTQEELQMGAVKYLREMDGLSKATGIQRKELEAGINKARSIQQFRAKVNEMRASGDERLIRQAAEMEKAFAYVNTAAPHMIQGFAEGVTGMISSDAGRQFVQAIEQQTGAARGLADGTFDAIEAINLMQGAAKQTSEDVNYLGQMGAADAFIGSLAELSDLGAREKIDKEKLQKFLEDQTKGTENAVKDQVDMRRAQRDSRDALQQFVADGVTPATSIMKDFAEVMRGVVEALEGIAGMFGYKKSEHRQFQATMAGESESAAQRGGRTTAGAAAGATTGAAIGSVVPGVGTAIGGVVGGIVGGAAGYFAGPEQVNPEDYIRFTSGTGSREHFAKLDPKVGQAFLDMARDYNQFTQEKLQVNSAFRSPEEQAAIDPGTNPKAAPGMSLHQHGRAIDIQSEQVRYLMRSGLLSKYGFKDLPGDPPHIYMRDGGIASGPDAGYPATLHGTEAVVPLPNGRSIPVDIGSSMDGMIAVMSDMRSQLEQLNRGTAPGTGQDQLQAVAENIRVYLESAAANTSNLHDTHARHMADLVRNFDTVGSHTVDLHQQQGQHLADLVHSMMQKSQMTPSADLAGLGRLDALYGSQGPDMQQAVRELMSAQREDTADALRATQAEFRTAMDQVVQELRQHSQDPVQQEILSTLRSINRNQGRTADASQRMADVAMN
jgi:hypothetical protein